MKKNASQQMLVRLLVLTMGTLPACLPGVACLSGQEQCWIMQAWTGTATDIAAGALAEAAPQDVPGDGGILDALWNGGVEWSLGLAAQLVNNCACRNGDCGPAWDPFPFPTETPPCCGP
jgi:hypothetical protein